MKHKKNPQLGLGYNLNTKQSVSKKTVAKFLPKVATAYDDYDGYGAMDLGKLSLEQNPCRTPNFTLEVK